MQIDFESYFDAFENKFKEQITCFSLPGAWVWDEREKTKCPKLNIKLNILISKYLPYSHKPNLVLMANISTCINGR